MAGACAREPAGRTRTPAASNRPVYHSRKKRRPNGSQFHPVVLPCRHLSLPALERRKRAVMKRVLVGVTLSGGAIAGTVGGDVAKGEAGGLRTQGPFRSRARRWMAAGSSRISHVTSGHRSDCRPADEVTAAGRAQWPCAARSGCRVRCGSQRRRAGVIPGERDEIALGHSGRHVRIHRSHRRRPSAPNIAKQHSKNVRSRRTMLAPFVATPSRSIVHNDRQCASRTPECRR